MNGDGGLVLMLFGAIAMLLSVTERVVSHRRWLEAKIESTIDPALRTAFPPPRPSLELERLASDAEAVLDSQELCQQGRRWQRRHRTARGR